MHNTAAAQNTAHRADLAWIKVGPSEYQRADGVTIRKERGYASSWGIYLANGDRAQMPNQFAEGGFLNTPAWGHTLTVAKFNAEDIDASTPAFVKVAR